MGDGFFEWRTRLIIRYLQAQYREKRDQRLHIIAAGKTVIAQNGAVIPKLLDWLGCKVSH